MDNQNSISDSVEVTENGKSKKTLVIALGAAIAVAAVVLTIALISVVMQGEMKNTDDSKYVLTSTEKNNESTTEIDIGALLGNLENTDKPTQVTLDNQGNQANNKTTQKPTKNAAVEYYEHLSPNGENKLSDHHENKYIKKISSKYNIDTELLVAIYSDPDTGNNFVLQFRGERDSEGLVIKSPDTLVKVYHIDKKGNITIATGTEKGNVGVSYGEGMLVFNMIKTIVMEQYPNYFTGIEK